jgi:hypothetical protein
VTANLRGVLELNDVLTDTADLTSTLAVTP